jgi:hypothetical protein
LYQGARTVRQRGLYRETKQFVRVVLASTARSEGRPRRVDRGCVPEGELPPVVDARDELGTRLFEERSRPFGEPTIPPVGCSSE